MRQERNVALRLVAPMRSSAIPVERGGAALAGDAPNLACHLGDADVAIAVLELVGMVERIDDQQRGADPFQVLDDSVAVGKNDAVRPHRSERDAAAGTGEKMKAADDGLEIDVVVQTGGGDAALPFELVVFIGDDADGPPAPDALAEQVAAGDHR